jgi:hypothetical protein
MTPAPHTPTSGRELAPRDYRTQPSPITVSDHLINTVSPTALAMHTFLTRQYILTKQDVRFSKGDAMMIDPTLNGGDYVRGMKQLEACGAVQRRKKYGTNHFHPCWITPTKTAAWTPDPKERFGRPSGHYTPVERTLFDIFLGSYAPGAYGRQSSIVRYASMSLLSFKDIGIYIINLYRQRKGLPAYKPRGYRKPYDLSRLVQAGLLDAHGHVYPVPSLKTVLIGVSQLAFGSPGATPVLTPLGVQTLGLTKNALFHAAPSQLETARVSTGIAHPIFFVPPGMINFGSNRGLESMIDSQPANQSRLFSSESDKSTDTSGQEPSPWTHDHMTHNESTTPAFSEHEHLFSELMVKVPDAVFSLYVKMNNDRVISEREWGSLCHLAEMAGGWEIIGAILRAAAVRRAGMPTTLDLKYVATSLAQRAQEEDLISQADGRPADVARDGVAPEKPARRRRAGPRADSSTTAFNHDTYEYLTEKAFFSVREFAHLPCAAVREYVDARLAKQVPVGVIVAEMRQSPPLYTAAELKAQAETDRAAAEVERDARLRAEQAEQDAKEAQLAAWASQLEAEAQAMRDAWEQATVQCLPEPQDATDQLRSVLATQGAASDLLQEMTVLHLDQTLMSAYALIGVTSARCEQAVGTQWRATIKQWLADAGGYDVTAPQTSAYPAQWVGIGVCRMDSVKTELLPQAQPCDDGLSPEPDGVELHLASGAEEGAPEQQSDVLPETLAALLPAFQAALRMRSSTPGHKALAIIASALTNIAILREDGDQLREINSNNEADEQGAWRPEHGDVVLLSTSYSSVHRLMADHATSIAEILGLLFDRRPEVLAVEYRQQWSSPKRTSQKQSCVSKGLYPKVLREQ